MTDIYELLNELDHKKLILFLNREKKPYLTTFLSKTYPHDMNVPVIGKVRNLNCMQYILSKMIIENENISVLEQKSNNKKLKNDKDNEYENESLNLKNTENDSESHINNTNLETNIESNIDSQLQNLKIPTKTQETRSISASTDTRDDYYRSFLIIQKRIDISFYHHKDSNNNNLLHYCSVFGDYDLCKNILESNIRFEMNSNNLFPFDLCKNQKTKSLLMKWGRNNHLVGKNDVRNENEDRKTNLCSDIDNNNNKRVENEEYSYDFGNDSNKNLSSSNKIRDEHEITDENDKIKTSTSPPNENSSSSSSSPSDDQYAEMNISKLESLLENEVDHEIPESILNNNNSELNSNVLEEINNLSKEIENINLDKKGSPMFKNDTNKYENEGFGLDDQDNSILDLVPQSNDKELTSYIDNNDDSNTIIEHKKEPVLEQKVDKTVTLFRSIIPVVPPEKLEEVTTEIRKINKYPGILYLYLGNLSGFTTKRKDIEGVFIRTIYNDDITETELLKCSENICINKLFTFTVNDPNQNIIIYLVLKFKQDSLGKIFKKKDNRKSAYTIYKINNEVINAIHNNISGREVTLKKYKTNNILRIVSDVFDKKLPIATHLKTHLSYISEDELQYVKANKPTNMKSLSYWLRYRKNSFNKWYSGYINIRGENVYAATHLWKRRFIQWHGYLIKIYNESSGLKIGEIDVSSARFEYNNNNNNQNGKGDGHKNKNYVENSFRLGIRGGYVEIQFDNREKYGEGLNALAYLLNIY